MRSYIVRTSKTFGLILTETHAYPCYARVLNTETGTRESTGNTGSERAGNIASSLSSSTSPAAKFIKSRTGVLRARRWGLYLLPTRAWSVGPLSFAPYLSSLPRRAIRRSIKLSTKSSRASLSTANTGQREIAAFHFETRRSSRMRIRKCFCRKRCAKPENSQIKYFHVKESQRFALCFDT